MFDRTTVGLPGSSGRHLFWKAFLVMGGMLLPAWGAWGGPMPLEPYLATVLEQNRDLAASAARLQAARAAAETVAASQRPTMGLRGEAGRVFREQDGHASLYFSVNARIDLWGKFDKACQQALLAHDLRAARHAELVNTLLAAAEGHYWRAVIARADVMLYESLVKQREEDFRVVVKRHEVGSVAKLDVIRAEVQLERTRGALTNARTVYRDVLASLAALAGGGDVEPLSDDLRPPIPDIAPDAPGGLDRRPDLVALGIAQKLAGVDRDLAALGMRPELSASLAYTLATDNDHAAPPEHDGSIALVVSVPLSDGGVTRSQTAEKSALRGAASEDLVSAKIKAEEEVRLIRNAWDRAVSLESTKSREKTLAAEELRIAELRYREGTGTQLDLLDAQVREQSARKDYLDAVKEMYLALARLRGALGVYAERYVR